jgi:GT2 family glycosyltransferase
LTFISAVVASHNNEPTIEKCLQSLTQNELDEIVLVDGDSHDRTLEIARRFDIHVVMGVKGIGKAKDVGWRQTNGDLIFFLDADAFIESNTIERLRRRLSEPNVAGVSCRLACANPYKLPAKLRDLDFLLEFSEEFKRSNVLECTLLNAGHPTACGLFTRRSLESVGGIDARYPYAEDLKLLKKMKVKGYRVLMVYEPAVYHYHRENCHDLYHQFYGHGLGRRMLRDELGYEFYEWKKPWDIARRIVRNANALGIRGLLCYPAYRCFTETAFRIGYLHRQSAGDTTV